MFELVKLATVAIVFSWLAYKAGDRVGFHRGYKERDATYEAAARATNRQIEVLRTELEAERAEREAERERAATNAIVGIPNLPKCVVSECALSAEQIARLNEVD